MSYPVELRNAEDSSVRESGLLVFTGSQPGGTSVSNVTALAQQANSGATSITLNTTPTWVAAQTFVIVAPKTTGANLRRVTNVSNGVLTLDRALGATFAANTTVFVWTGGPALIPWSLWGGLPSNLQGDATTNTTAFNNLTQEIYNLGNTYRQWGIGVDVGYFYVNGELKPERDQALASASPLSSQILAADSFPFTADGSVAIIHPQRDGSPVLYHQAGPSGRWFFTDLYVSGRGLANSNGIITSPQQPDGMKGVRTQACAGYGLSINDCQVYAVENHEADECGLPLDLWSSFSIRLADLNYTTTLGSVMCQLIDTTSVHFDTADFETMPTGGKIVSATGLSNDLSFTNIYTSGFTGGSTGDVLYFNCPTANPGGKCNYTIRGLRCNQNSATVNMVNDVQRSITLNSFADTNRMIMEGWAQDTLYWYTVAGGKIKTNAAYIT